MPPSIVNTWFAILQAVVVGALFCGSLAHFRHSAKKRAVFPAICGLLLAMHPAWTISATSGDCGIFKAITAAAFSGVAGLIVVAQLGIDSLRDRRSEWSSPTFQFRLRHLFVLTAVVAFLLGVGALVGRVIKHDERNSSKRMQEFEESQANLRQIREIDTWPKVPRSPD